MITAAKYRLYPNKSQVEMMEKTFSAKASVWNRYLKIRKDAYENEGKTLRYRDLSKDLTAYRAVDASIQEADRQALSQVLRQQDAAFDHFFRRVKQKAGPPGYPKPKDEDAYAKSYTTYGAGIQVSDRAVRIPKIGWVRARVTPIVKGRILSLTVSLNSAGQYHASICYADAEAPEIPSTGAAVGLQLGLDDIVSTSDGERFACPQYYERELTRVQTLSRQLSRQVKGSNNYEKTRLALARLHQRIADRRKDFLQKLSTDLVRRYDIICVPDVKPKMRIDRGGTIARRQTDASWAELVRMLSYKAERCGKEVVRIPWIAENPDPDPDAAQDGAPVEPMAATDARAETAGTEAGTEGVDPVEAAKKVLLDGLALRRKASGEPEKDDAARVPAHG